MCQRCYKDTNITIMSMYNTQILCMDCKEAETKRPDYRAASDADVAEIRKGNFNFKGVGLGDV